jgi:hypothetical protein
MTPAEGFAAVPGVAAAMRRRGAGLTWSAS